MTELQRLLLPHWRTALGSQHTDPTAGLGNLDAGGRARLLHAIETDLGEPLHSVALFEAPTIEAFAAYLERHYPAAAARWLGKAGPPSGPRGTAGIDEGLLAGFQRRFETTAPTAPPVAQAGGPLFVLAPPRSGTTLLRVMLAGHPRLFAPPELELLGFESLRARRQACAGGLEPLLEGAVAAVAEAHGCDPASAEAKLAELEAADASPAELYRGLQGRLGEGVTLVDKTTSYALAPGALARAEAWFGAPRYLHLTREPAATVRSFEASRLDRLLLRGRHGYSPRQLGELVWLAGHRNIRDFLARVPTSRWQRLRFEDLLADPRAVMERLCDWLGIGFDDRVLTPYDGAPRRMTRGLHVPTRLQGDPGFHAHRGIGTPRFGSDGLRGDSGDGDAAGEAQSLDLCEATSVLAAELGYEVSRAPMGATAPAVALPDSLVSLFDAQARRRPDAVALVSGDRELSYAELAAAAGAFSARLAAAGVGRGEIVGLWADRSPAMLVGLLGILRAGAAYLPLDPAHPPSRLAFVLADAGVARIVGPTPPASEALPVPGLRTLSVDLQTRADCALPLPRPGDPAYAIYTSGSTGRPKGVLVPHAAACHTVRAEIQALEVGPESRVLQFASLGFDTSVVQIFMALGAGARLVAVPAEAMHSHPRLLALLRGQAVSHADLPPSVLARLPDEGLPALRVVSTGGERCPSETARRWSRDRRFFHCYGTTESAICSAMLACHGFTELGTTATLPIGRPLPGSELRVVDPGLRRLPVGEVGELCVGGPGLALGYVNDPERTAQRFVADPEAPDADARLYRTGDLARQRADGLYELLGRVDDQVKIRGIRVEPGEIEAALRAHPAVVEVAVLAREDAAGERRLVAHVVRCVDAAAPPEKREDPSQSLRAFLRARLPEALVPAQWDFLDALPRNAACKVDRSALLARTLAPASAPVSGTRTSAEIGDAIAAIWRAVLGREEIGWHDDFFDLGGSSLQVAEVHDRLGVALGRELPVADLFQHPTLASLARHIEAWQGGATPGFSAVRERAERKRRAATRQRVRRRAAPSPGEPPG